ncbi:MAG: hypothetical protein DRQ51_03170 [Gammaproteobacteria bacterium]|nr:MAG: hypothetical protein DRQ51_03170 [Gammaproteobacteria bacterium]
MRPLHKSSTIYKTNRLHMLIAKIRHHERSENSKGIAIFLIFAIKMQYFLHSINSTSFMQRSHYDFNDR